MSVWKFDGSNFSYYMEQMQDYLVLKGQTDLIENIVASVGIKLEE